MDNSKQLIKLNYGAILLERKKLHANLFQI